MFLSLYTFVLIIHLFIAHTQCQTSAPQITGLVAYKSICAEHLKIRSTHRQKRKINLNLSDWHWRSWVTRVTLMVGSSCCPPSLPPSCLTQLMSKLSSLQRRQCAAGENTMLFFFFTREWKSSPSFNLPFKAHSAQVDVIKYHHQKTQIITLLYHI